MKVVVLTPTVAQVTFNGKDDNTMKQVASLLSYTEPNAAYLTQKHVRDWRYKHRDLTGWQRYLEMLKEKEIKKMYQEQAKSVWRFRTGSIHLLLEKNILHVDDVLGAISPPTVSNTKPLITPLPYDLYPYQEQALTALLNHSHAHIEICTGSGKATIALLLAQRLGVKCVVVVPFKENARALLDFFRYHLGKNCVGLYGDGVKNLGYQITICIGKSLSNITAESKPQDYKFFRHQKVMIVDESHTWAAETMEELCHGLFAHVPYRYFMSGTQEKSVQQENLLASIIGPRVFSLGTAEAVKQGFVCPHEYIIYENVPLTPVGDDKDGPDATNVLALRRHHLFLNPAITQFVAKSCVADLKQKQCSLILVEEVGQVDAMVSLWATLGLKEWEDYSVATGRRKAGSVAKAVTAFNAGDVGILIGTSCIATGVNLYPQHKTYNLCGGGAVNSVRTCQGAVGRSVRFATSNPAIKDHSYPTDKFDVKTKTLIIDFDLDQSQKHLHRHLKKRLDYYALSGSNITFRDFQSELYE